MEVMERKRKPAEQSMGLKRKVSSALESKGPAGLTMGELMLELDLERTHASEVSSVLCKLKQEGRIETLRTKATSQRGRAEVRRYVWLMDPVRTAPPTPVVVVPHPLNSLFLMRG